MSALPESLHAAREARRQHRLADARVAYERCLAQGHPVTVEYARFLQEAGDTGRALAVLDRGLADSPQATDIRFARALLLAESGRLAPAVADYNALLAVEPDSIPVLFNRASALFRLEDLDAAAADFIRVARLKPDAFDALANAGVIRMRQQRHPEALELLRGASAIAPDNPQVLHKLAGALRTGEEALQLYGRIEALLPDDPAILTDHGLCLLDAGNAGAARSRFERAFERSPGDQTALAGLYLAAIACDQPQAAAQLMDYPRLLAVDTPPGIGSLQLDALHAAVLAHPELRWEPAGRSTRHGQQSTMLELASGPFAPLGRLLERTVQQRLSALATDASLVDHPWLRSLPRRWRLQAWATVLHQGGNQSPHIHPAGWMSGVFYLDPGQPQSIDAGQLVFGHPPEDVRVSGTPHEFRLRPERGRIACFPSYFLHHTTPYDGTGRPRISLAFDVIPLPA